MKYIYILIFLMTTSIFSSQTGIILNDLKDNKVSIDAIKKENKLILINFWATWCAPCKKELPILNKLYKKYQDKGFTVISISMDESSELTDVKTTVLNLGLTFPVLLDFKSIATDHYNPSKNAPFSLLYQSNGKKIKTFLGFTSSDEEELEALILEELNKETKDSKQQNFSWSFSTLDTYTRYFDNKEDPIFSNYEFLTTRTHLMASYKNYSVSTSFYTNNFLSTTKYIRSKYDKESSYRLEKIALKGRLYNQSFTLGDFHIVQGNGVALSLNKQDDLGIDTTLQGINLDLTYKKINLVLFGGMVNNTNHDTTNNELFNDKRDIILGSTLSVQAEKGLTLSANYNTILFKEPDFNTDNIKPENYKQHQLQVIGANIRYDYNSVFGAYLEGNTLVDNYYNEEEKLEDAHALYASLYFSYKNFIFTQEFKKYKKFHIGFKSDLGNSSWTHAKDSVYYNNPATLERTGEKVKDIANDIWGLRSNLKYKLNDSIKPYINYLYSLSGYEERDRRTHHLYAGSEFYFNELKNKIDFSLSLRLEKDKNFNDAIQSNTTDNYYGFELDASFYFTSFLSLDLKGYVHRTEKSLIGKNKIDHFNDVEFATTLTLFKDVFISYLYNHFNFSEEVGSKHNYHAADLKYRFLHDSYIRFFYGSIRGGIKCIGGVCKDYPEFNGFKTELLLSF